MRRENQEQAAEHIERVRQEVAARRQEASKLKVMREELRKREEEVGRERDLLNTKFPAGAPGKYRGKEEDPHQLDGSRGHTRHLEGAIGKGTRGNTNTQAGPNKLIDKKKDKGRQKDGHQEDKGTRANHRGRRGHNITHHGPHEGDHDKETEGQERERGREEGGGESTGKEIEEPWKPRGRRRGGGGGHL